MKRAFFITAALVWSLSPTCAQVEQPPPSENAQSVEELSRQVTQLQRQLEALKGGDAASAPKLADLEKQVQRLSEQIRSIEAARPPAAPDAPAAPEAPVAPPAPAAGIEQGAARVHGGDLVRVGGSYTVGPDEVIRGDAAITGGSLVVDGRVQGDAAVIGGSMTVNGSVGGDVVVMGGSLTLGPQSHVGGEIKVVGGQVHREDGAVVEGGVHQGGVGRPRVEVPGVVDFGHVSHGKSPLGSLPGLVMLFLVGAVLLAAVPNRIDTIGRMFVAKPAHSFLVGLVGSLAAFMASVLTCGIGLLLTVPLMTTALLMGLVAVTVILGRRVLIGKTYRSRLMPLLTGLGMWFLALVAATAVEPLRPFLWIITWMAIIAATGAALTTGFGKNAVWLRNRMGGSGAAYDPASSYAEF
jgi:hypothetical protein